MNAAESRSMLELEARVDPGWTSLILRGIEGEGLEIALTFRGDVHDSETVRFTPAKLANPWALVVHVPVGVRSVALGVQVDAIEVEKASLESKSVSRAFAFASRVRAALLALCSGGASTRRAWNTIAVSTARGGARGLIDALLAPPQSPMFIPACASRDERPLLPDAEALRRLRHMALDIDQPPLLSILMPVFNPDLLHLKSAIESVREQTYPHWQLCIADDASTNPQVRDYLQAVACDEPRFRITFRDRNGHISAASNSALALSDGAYVALLDQDDLLAPHALHAVAACVLRARQARLIYSDEDKIDEQGRHFGPYYKPDWDPYLVLGQNMFSHLGVFERKLVVEAGGFQPGREGSQDYDLLLRCVAIAGDAAVQHIPHVLYHWRAIPGSTARSMSAKSYATRAAIEALQEALPRQYGEGQVVPAPFAGGYLFRPKPRKPRRSLSVLLPCDPAKPDTWCRRVLSTVVGRETDVELITCGDSSLGTQDAPVTKVAGCTDALPVAMRLNMLARRARHELLVCLHPGLVPTRDAALDALADLFVRPDVAAVAPRIRDARHRIIHAGYVRGMFGRVGSPFEGHRADSPGYFGQLRLLRSASAASGAAFVCRRDVWNELGGFDAERHPWREFDVEFGLRIASAGYRILVSAEVDWMDPVVRSCPRQPIGWYWPEPPPAEPGRSGMDFPYWLEIEDPTYNPNLTLAHDAHFVDPNPRVAQLWQMDGAR